MVDVKNRPAPTWHEDYREVVTLAFWLYDEGQIVTASDALAYFDKPWKFADEWQLMRDSRAEEEHADQLLDADLEAQR